MNRFPKAFQKRGFPTVLVFSGEEALILSERRVLRFLDLLTVER